MKNELGLRIVGVFVFIDTQHFSELVHSLNLPAYEDGTDRLSETSACKIQTPGNYPEERKQHSEHGESLKSRTTEFSRWPVE